MALHILESSGRFKPFKKQIEETIQKTHNKVSGMIPLKVLDIVVYDWPDRTIKGYGVGGYTPNAYLVEIALNPIIKIDTIIENLRRTCIHELHHASRWTSVGYGTTLIEALVTEGLAEHFEIELTKGKPNPWDIILSEQKLEKYSEMAKREYASKDYNHNVWFYGYGNSIPKWAGYAIGFDIVGTYLKKHKDKKPSNIHNAKAELFL